jgi:hypothetical protein
LELREQLQYFNHTDYFPLRQQPVVLSAKSKKPGEGYQDAQVQLGVWQAAQWAFFFFESLLASQCTGAEAGPAVIPFLPALIIQGHEWSFAATTLFGKQTVCYRVQFLRFRKLPVVF